MAYPHGRSSALLQTCSATTTIGARRFPIHVERTARRRGKTSAEDDELKNELLNDPKERAEHLMLVDLARNDLGRVCTNGSVEVTRFMEVEQFSHVMHIVSDVQGKVSPQFKTIQVLRSAFPAGTISGAPKISAIQILRRIEKNKAPLLCWSSRLHSV